MDKHFFFFLIFFCCEKYRIYNHDLKKRGQKSKNGGVKRIGQVWIVQYYNKSAFPEARWYEFIKKKDMKSVCAYLAKEKKSNLTEVVSIFFFFLPWIYVRVKKEEKS